MTPSAGTGPIPGTEPVPFAAPVDGGDLCGGRWSVPAAGSDPVSAGTSLPPVVAVHGITSNHLGWAKVARHLLQTNPARAVVAPDLRGRVRSAALPGPTGIRRHAADLVALLDDLGIERTVLAGHSMGAWVVAMVAVQAPERVEGLVLVDGGVSPAVSLPDDSDPQAALDAILGPAVARLAKTYPSRDAYLAEWQAHPAFTGGIDRDTRAVLLADLAGSGFAWRSNVREDAVRTDGAELIVDDEVRFALTHSSCPAVIVRAERGLFDDPNPLLPLDAVEALVANRPNTTLVDVPGTNHYSVLLAEPGAAIVAGAVSDVAEPPHSPQRR